MGLITTDQLLTYVPALQGANTAILQAFIEAASGSVERFCNRTFAYDNNLTERIFAGTPTRIYLRRYPVDVIYSISLVSFATTPGCDCNTISSDGATNATETLITDRVPYLLNKANGEVQLLPQANPMPWWQTLQPNQFIVNYAGGFQEIPDPVKLATALLTKQQYDLGTKDLTLKSERIGDYSYERFGISDSLMGLAVPHGTMIAQLLLPYQKLGVNGL